MEAVVEMFEELGAAGNVLGNLSPNFHTISSASHNAADIDLTKELAKLGAIIAKFNPREVNIWG
jgi:hypothetical protein